MPTNVHTDFPDLKLGKVKIKYIGKAVREALIKGGIKTVAELAASSVEEIESALEHEVPPPTRTEERISEMIQGAQELLKTQEASAAQADSTPEEDQLVSVPEFTLFFNYGIIEDDQKRWRALIHPHDDGDKPEPPAWHPNPADEGYTVRFERLTGEDSQEGWRTVVYNGKSLEFTDITGWTPDQWWPWITEKASLIGEAFQVKAHTKEAVESMPAVVSIKPAEADEPPAEKELRITRFEHHRLTGDDANRLVAEVDFEISDDLLAQGPPYFQVEVLYTDSENKNGDEKKASHFAGYDNKELVSEQRTYESQVKFELPELGAYIPHCVVLLPSGELAGYQKGEEIIVIAKK